jgi:hypothetical protein
MLTRFFICLSVFLFFVAFNASATHLRCGRIIVNQEKGSRTVDITVEYFTNTTNTTVLFGGDQDVLDFGDGRSMLVPEQPNQSYPWLPDNIRYASFSVKHTYASFGVYIVSYKEPNRNEGVLNIDAAVTTTAYVETKFTLMETTAFSSAEPLLPPIFYAYAGRDFSAAITAPSAEGDSVSYALAVPLSDRSREVKNYRHPGMVLDHVTGLLTWDCKFEGLYRQGEFLFAVKIFQWRKINGAWTEVGYTLRDLQAIVYNDPTHPAPLVNDDQSDEHLAMVKGSNRTIRILADATAGEFTLSVETDLPQDAITVQTYDSTSGDRNMIVGKVTLIHTCDLKPSGYYMIVVRADYLLPIWYQKDLVYTWGVDVPTSNPDYKPGPDVDPDPVQSIDNGETVFSVVPNPVKNSLTIKGATKPGWVLQIYAQDGKLVSTLEMGGVEYDIDRLPPGMYFLRIREPNGKSTTSQRFVKE